MCKLNAAGSALLYCTYLGRSGDEDAGRAIALDAAGNAYVSGSTDSSNFPVTPGTFQATLAGGGFRDVFVSKLNVAGSALSYSTYLGGTEEDDSIGIAVDVSGNAYVTGVAGSGFPLTPAAFQTTYGGGAADVFVVRLNSVGSGLLYSTFLGGSGADGPYSFGLAVDSSGDVYLTSRTFSSNLPTTATAFQKTYGGNGTARRADSRMKKSEGAGLVNPVVAPVPDSEPRVAIAPLSASRHPTLLASQ